MDVFCPSCLHSVTLEGREPGQYAFECPECAAETHVTIPEDPGARPIVRPARARSAGSDSEIERPGKAQARRPRRASDRDSIDFPFQESDQNLIEHDEQPARDEWQEAGEEIPQPLRGVVRKAKTATASLRQQRPAGTPRSVYKWLGAGAAVWLVLVVAGFFIRELAWVPIVLGGLIIFAARGMVMRVARTEGVAVWLACLLVPFYSLMFIFTHFRVLSRAVVIGFCGWGFLLSGVALIVIHDVIDAQANALPGAVDPLFGGNPNGADDGLVLSIDNNETPIALDELTYFPASVEEGSGGECFEFVGTDVSLRGKFPPRFRDRWVDLLGKSVPLLPQTNHPDRGASHIKIPGRGMVKVVGGSFSVEGILRHPVRQLGGSMVLKIDGPNGIETIDGTFLVRVKPSE
jgi:hypothetical protein